MIADTLVYAMHDAPNARIKIGYSLYPLLRMSGVRASEKCDAVLIAETPGDYMMEREFHRLLAPWNCGSEWFHDCRAVRRLITERMTPVTFRHRFCGQHHSGRTHRRGEPLTRPFPRHPDMGRYHQSHRPSFSGTALAASATDWLDRPSSRDRRTEGSAGRHRTEEATMTTPPRITPAESCTVCARCRHPASEHHATDGCERVLGRTMTFCRCEGYVAPGACRHCDGTGLVRELEDGYPLPSTTCPTCGGASP